MGNHTAGRLIHQFSIKFAAARQPGESAMDVLDKAVAEAKRSPDFSPDAEFESTDPNNPDCVHPEYASETDPHPEATLGMLMVEAFAPNGLADLPRYTPMLDGTGQAEEDACDAWWSEVKEPFRTRYGLC